VFGKTFHSRMMIVAMLVIGQAACAQPESAATLRQQITELERTVETLRTQLDEVSAQRQRLLAEVALLREAVAGGAHPTTPNKPAIPGQSPASGSFPISALSQEPLSSPDALYISLLLEYREAFSPQSLKDGAVSADEAEVLEWVGTMKSRLEGQATWLVRIDQVIRTVKKDHGEPLRVRAIVLDPTTAKPTSRAVMLKIPSRFEGRFPDILAADEVLYCELRLKVRAEPVFQPGRETPGPFNYPPFIGPYAGFDFSAEPTGLRFIEPDEIAAKKSEPKPPVDR